MQFSDYTLYVYLIFISITVLTIGQVFSRQLIYSINTIRNITSSLALGILPKGIEVTGKSDTDLIVDQLGQLSERLYYYTHFIQEIGEGRFNENFKPLNKDDVLGIALQEMQINLVQAHKKEKERTWIVKGIAEIGEILRSHSSIQDLGLPVIKFLVSATNSVQGALYVVSQDNGKAAEGSEFNMVACYAYNRKKFISNSFRVGEGLAGQAAYEKQSIVRIEIPDNYFTISSGILGDKKPTCLLIVPLVSDEKVYGVLEFGSLNILSAAEVKFVEEVAPIIARTIFNILVNEKTSLLLEQSQQMSAELQKQGEILRKNAEEMEVAQEELTRVNHSLTEQMEEVGRSQKRMQLLLENASEVITIYEEDTTIRYISPSVKNILGYDQEELTGKKGKTHVYEEDYSVSEKMFHSLLEQPEGIVTIQYQFRKKNGEFVWLEATGKNLLSDTAVKGILINARDITAKRRAETEERMRRNMQSLSENSPDLITRITAEGNITYTNPAIETYAGVKPEEFIRKKLSELTIAEELIQAWQEIISDVTSENGKVSKECSVATPAGHRVVQVNGIPEYNESQLESVLVVAHDITERKTIELEVQDKNKKINESINYSKRIQNAIVPDTDQVKKALPESFIFYKPKDVVSGDFPWFLRKGEEIYVAAVDCTGHGVPGAMLSLVGCFLLNDVVEFSGLESPAPILDFFDNKFNTTLNIEDSQTSIKDGMDLALCRINLNQNLLEFSGAHRPLYLLRDNEITEFKGDKWAIGGGTYKNQTNFTNHQIHIQKGDSVYFFSDGLPDQFGGPENRKFGPKRIRDLIVENAGKSMDEMNVIFEERFNEWMGTEKQMDDVLLIGIRF